MSAPSDAAGARLISVIVPVYENAESLPTLFGLLLSVEALLAERGCALDLIFVDDGSTDESLATLLDLRQRRPSTRVVKLTRNFGAIAAIKTGLKIASGDCATWLSADLQDPPELIVALVDRWLTGARYVVAVRGSRRDPAGSALLSTIYHRLVRLLLFPDYPHGGFDLALLDKSLLSHLVNSPRQTNLALLSHWLGVEPAYVTYERLLRPFGKSRWTLAKKLGYAVDSVLGFSPLPLRFALLATVIAAAISGACGGILLIAGRDPVAVLLSGICLLLGAMVVLLGAIGEYAWRIYDAVSGRPDAVIDTIYEA